MFDEDKMQKKGAVAAHGPARGSGMFTAAEQTPWLLPNLPWDVPHEKHP